MTLSNNLRAVGLALALVVAAPALVEAQPSGVAKINAYSLAKTQALGEAMYAQDQAAWKATDLMTAAKANMDGVFTWLASSHPGGQRVRWLKGSLDAPVAAYEVVFDGTSTPRFAPAADPNLSADDLAQLRALHLAKALPLPNCSQRSNNHIELRDPDTGEWLVWMLAPWTYEQGIAVGGHTRVTVSADGSRIVREERMSTGCFNMRPPPMKKGEPAILTTTQIVADTPLETHVFNALQTHLLMAVLTPDGNVWGIDGHSIEKVMNLNDRQAKPKR